MSRKRDYQLNPLDFSSYKIPEFIEDCPLAAWQKEVFDYWGDLAIRSGRQVGKSQIMAKKVAQAALKYNGSKWLVSAASERQAAYLFEKIKLELRAFNEDVFAETPTMRRMLLKNASEIYCLPTGKTGDLIRGLTLDGWIPDEASYINDQVRVAISPMLWRARKLFNRGWTWALSTPAGKQGFFYNLFDPIKNPGFRTWHIKSTDCTWIASEDLEKWKNDYSRVEYSQEVLGEFIDEVSRLFSEALLDKCFKKELDKNFISKYITLGVDVARFGSDKNAFVNAMCNYKRKIQVNRAETTERKSIYETFDKIMALDITFKYNKILIDDAGVGGGLADFLIQRFPRKIICTNNAKKVIDADGTEKGLLKPNMYSTAIVLMEKGDVEILENDDLRSSLASMQFFQEGDTLKIAGRDSHLAEAFVRALWGIQQKGLNLFVHAY